MAKNPWVGSTDALLKAGEAAASLAAANNNDWGYFDPDDKAALDKYMSDFAAAQAKLANQGKTSSGGGGGGIKKSNDKPQADALRKMLKTSFAKQRNTKLGNVERTYKSNRDDLLKGYNARADQLSGSRLDNEKSEHDASMANNLNRLREQAETLENTALQGAGESDTLKSKIMAVRNQDANQQEINRSYHDSARGINSAITDLTADTRSGWMNLYTGKETNREQIYNDYYNQRTDAWTQLGNLNSNLYSNQQGKHKSAYNNAATTTGQSYKTKAVPTSLKNWKGTVQPDAKKLNNSILAPQSTDLSAPAPKKPEGATLRKW